MKPLDSVFDLRPGEATRVGWLLLHSLFVGLFIAFYLATANALFLYHFGAEGLPYAYIASGILGTLAMRTVGRWRRRMELATFFLACLSLLLLAVGALYLAALLWPGAEPGIAFGLFIALGPSLSLINLEFWGLAGCLFDLRQSKRFFPLISIGETVSAIAGFVFVPLLLPRLATAMHLLAPVVGGLALSIFLVLVLRQRYASELRAGGEALNAGEQAVAAKGLGTALRDRYFVLAAAVIALATAVLYLIDFSFLHQLNLRYDTPQQLAAFIGFFYGGVKVLDLLLKTLVAGRILARFGLYASLLVLPVALLVPIVLAAVVSVFLDPEIGVFFFLVALAKLLWPVLRKSIFDPSFKVLYQPLPASRRLGFQATIEGTVRQVGTLLIGLLLLVVSRDGVSSQLLVLALVPVLAGWIALLGALHREYRARLLANLSTLPHRPLIEARSAEAPSVALDSETRRVDELRQPDPRLRDAAVEALVGRGFQAVGEQRAEVHDVIEQVGRQAIHVLEALADLDGSPHAEVTAALDVELLGHRQRLHLLLALLYDPRAIAQVRESLGEKAGEAAAYALEILDTLVTNELRPLVVPLLADLEPKDALKRLTSIVEPQRLPARERLSALLQSRADLRVRAAALAAIGGSAPEPGSASAARTCRELTAHLFHPDQSLREIAVRHLRDLDPRACERALARLPFDERRQLERSLAPVADPASGPRTPPLRPLQVPA